MAQPRFKVIAKSTAEEEQYDIVGSRNLPKPSGALASVAQIIKSALGSGILSAHVAYMFAGGVAGLFLNMLLGCYMCFCLVDYNITYMKGYAEVYYDTTTLRLLPSNGHKSRVQAATGNFLIEKSNNTVLYMINTAVTHRTIAGTKCTYNVQEDAYAIDDVSRIRVFMSAVIGIELFGACASYQLIIAGTLKQIVENKNEFVTGEGTSIKIYLLIIWIPCILICLIRHLQYLAPFSMVGNGLVALCVIVTIYYSLSTNPTISGLTAFTNIEGVFRFLGMIVFSMSCSSQIMSIENNMKDPTKLYLSLFAGHGGIVGLVCLCGFFGYSAYLEKSRSPITFNFPMEVLPKILKVCIAIMIYITHALNFWIPFDTTYYYIKKCIKPERHVFWEYILRPLFVTGITLIAIIFPSIPDLMSFLGCFCLSNLSFIFPNSIYLLVFYERPGYGVMKWRLLRGIVFLGLGFILFILGTAVAMKNLYKVFGKEM